VTAAVRPRVISSILAAASLLTLAACSGSREAARVAGDVASLRIEGADNRGVSIAAAGDHVVVVWAATVEDQTNIYAGVSRDGGKTFDAPVKVNDIDGDARATGEQPPKVAIGRDVVVAWESKVSDGARIRLARSADGGRKFKPATTIHEPGLTGVRGWASLALDADGVAHVAWLDGRNAHPAGSTAPKPAEASAKSPESSLHAGHAEHAGHAGMHEPMRQDVFQAAIGSESTPAEAQVATNVCFCCRTSLAVGPNGATFVAFRNIFPTNLRDMAVTRSDDHGHTFGSPVRVSEDRWELNACPEDGPSIAVDAAGVLHIAWPTLVRGETDRKAVFYSFSSDGGRTFAPRMPINSAADVTVEAHPQIVSAGGRVFVVWDQSTSDGHRVKLSEITSAQGATTWTPRVGSAMTVSATEPGVYPAVASSSSATLVAWTAPAARGSEILVRRVPAGSHPGLP